MSQKSYCGIGWKYDIPMHLEYYEEIAYSLASEGYVLRTNTNKVGSQAFIRGVERYAKRRKVDIESLLEIYMPSPKLNGHLSGQPARINVKTNPLYEKALEMSAIYGDIDDAYIQTERNLRAISPFLCLGQELNQPFNFMITGAPLFKLNSENFIIDGFGFTGEVIRTIRNLSPNSKVFSYQNPEHRQRINKLIYMKRA